MADYLLDADTAIDFIDGYPLVVSLIQRLIRDNERLCICEVALAEVYAGLQPRHEQRALEFLTTLQFLSSTPAAAERAGRWRYEYARLGRVLPTMDVLIAATAVQHHATVVTGNVHDYPMPEVSLLPLPR